MLNLLCMMVTKKGDDTQTYERGSNKSKKIIFEGKGVKNPISFEILFCHANTICFEIKKNNSKSFIYKKY